MIYKALLPICDMTRRKKIALYLAILILVLIVFYNFSDWFTRLTGY